MAAGTAIVRVELLFNGQLIQFQKMVFTIEPTFTNRSVDVTFVTRPDASPDQLLCYSNWMNFCGLSCNFWPMKTYHMMYDAKDNWSGKCQLLVVEELPSSTSLNHVLRYADWKKHISKQKNTALFLGYDARDLDHLVFDFTSAKILDVPMGGKHAIRPNASVIGDLMMRKRGEQEKKDHDYLYAAAAAINVVKTGVRATKYGSYSLYQSLQKRNDRVVAHNASFADLEMLPSDNTACQIKKLSWGVFRHLVALAPAKGQLTALSNALHRNKIVIQPMNCPLAVGIVSELHRMVLREMLRPTQSKSSPTTALITQMEKKEFMDKLHPSTLIHACIAFHQPSDSISTKQYYKNLVARIEKIPSGNFSQSKNISKNSCFPLSNDALVNSEILYPASDSTFSTEDMMNRKWVQWVGRLQQFQPQPIGV